jgi:hypothetical protein
MSNIENSTATAAPEQRISDTVALDAICALLNTTDSGADVYQEVALLLLTAGRPFVDNPPVLETETNETVHGLPTAAVLVDGKPAIRMWVSRDGDLHAVVLDCDRPLAIDVLAVNGVTAEPPSARQ